MPSKNSRRESPIWSATKAVSKTVISHQLSPRRSSRKHERQQRLGELIEPEGLGMWLQAEAAFHKTGREVSSHGPSRSTHSDAPLKSIQSRRPIVVSEGR